MIKQPDEAFVTRVKYESFSTPLDGVETLTNTPAGPAGEMVILCTEDDLLNLVAARWLGYSGVKEGVDYESAFLGTVEGPDRITRYRHRLVSVSEDRILRVLDLLVD